MTDQEKWAALPEIPKLQPITTKCVTVNEDERNENRTNDTQD